MALRTDWCEVLRARLLKPGWDADTLPDYAPATDEQLRFTEERLGFALPPTLRRLYAEVANGGDVFRSGVIVCGAIGGCPGFYSPILGGTLDQRVWHSGWRLNDRVDRALQRHPGAYVQCEEAPDCFVSICDDGSDVSIDLDGLTGRLYQRWGAESMLYYRAGQGLPIEPGIENAYMQAIAFYAASVDEWIEHALKGMRPLSGTDGELMQEMLRDSGE